MSQEKNNGRETSWANQKGSANQEPPQISDVEDLEDDFENICINIDSNKPTTDAKPDLFSGFKTGNSGNKMFIASNSSDKGFGSNDNGALSNLVKNANFFSKCRAN